MHGRVGEHGHLRANNSSDLVACSEDFVISASDPSARTFSAYADTVFMPYIDRQ